MKGTNQLMHEGSEKEAGRNRGKGTTGEEEVRIIIVENYFLKKTFIISPFTTE